ncbi:MAG: synthase, epsilon subunit [Acidimicrobiaceae bacterium]|jgi:F-type H+-transporting ATPase subunit epsilon|nr:synthase, epsilon subunit [Acidimicrobiaceae bacterium]
MATPFHVEIVTPERILFAGEAEEVSMRTEEGEIAFLAHHEDFIGAIDMSVVRITLAEGTAGSTPSPGHGGAETGGEIRAAVLGGFVDVDQDANSVRILAGVAELAGDIDVDRARRALEAAESAVGAQTSTSTGTDTAGEPASGARPTGVMLAMLAPDSVEAAARRARIRLQAAGVSVTP